MVIYTLGYCGWKPEQIYAQAERLGAVLVDVRLMPRSRYAPWNAAAFAQALGDRYVWIRELGNLHYKGTFEQIQIADFPAGRAKLDTIAAAGSPVILLCGCPDVNLCHRKLLAERLAPLWHAEIVHFAPPGKKPLTHVDNGDSGGARLF